MLTDHRSGVVVGPRHSDLRLQETGLVHICVESWSARCSYVKVVAMAREESGKK